MLNNTDLEICARTVAELGCDQPEEVRSSLAWVLKNRLEQVKSAFGTLPDIPQACESVLREALPPRRRRGGVLPLSDAELCRIRATNYLVWAGDLDDRTGGAIACHRHDTSPAWSRHRMPTALLGSFLFFR
jgi:hypothetical protein